MEELDIVACGSELLQQVSANFTCYKDKAEMTLAEIEATLSREKGTATAPKQCQVEIICSLIYFVSNERRVCKKIVSLTVTNKSIIKVAVVFNRRTCRGKHKEVEE